MSTLTRFFFRAPYSAPKTGEILRWWEARRLPYNVAVGMAGVVSLSAVALFDVLPPGGKDATIPWGGILTSWVLQASSGVPFNVTSGTDDNCPDPALECPDGFLTDRPAGVGRNTGASTGLAAVNALRAVPYLDLPPVSRLEEPNFVQLDVRVAKPFPLGGEGHRGEAFLQVFNVFDRFNGGPIDGTATSRTFGLPVGQIGPPLTVELGFALSF